MKETIPFNFEEIYKQLETEFSKRGYDSPYEGSNLAQINTAMAYVTSMLNVNTAANINETLLTLAEKRKNILQDARILGYEASKKVSYRYELELKFKQIGKFLIPKYSVFLSNKNKYYYLGQDISVDIKNLADMNNFRLKIEVKEGDLYRYTNNEELNYLFNGVQNYIDIPFTNVEDDGIEVFATYYDPIKGKIDKEHWTKSKILMLDKRSTLDKEFIRQDNLDIGTPRLFFSYAGIGHELPAGAQLEVNVLVTKGPDGEADDDFTIDPFLTNFAEISDTKPKLLVTGVEEESDKSIKDNAPLVHNTAARVVTGFDYKAVCNSHPAVKDSIVWGGEDEIPIKLGNIYYSFLPSKNKRIYDLFNLVNKNYVYEGPNNKSTVSERLYFFLRNPNNTDDNYISNSELLSQEVNENLTVLSPGVWDKTDKYKLPALADNLRNPVYIYADFFIDVKKYKMGIPQSEIRQKIFDKLSERMEYLEHFDTTFFKSNMIKQLDNELSDIMGLELNPDFYIMINKENIAKRRIKSAFSNSLRSYINLTSNDTTANLSIWLPISGYNNDTIEVEFNKNIVLGPDGTYTNKDSIRVTDVDVINGLVKKSYDLTNINTLQKVVDVRYISKDDTIKLEGSDIQYFNINNKRIFFYPKINSQTSQLQIFLPKFVEAGDKIKVTAYYGNTNVKETSIVSDYTVTKNDKFNNYVEILDRLRGSYAGIVHPLTYEIELTKSDSRRVLGEACPSLDSAKIKNKEQNEVFNGLNLSELFYDFYTDEKGTHVTVWIPTDIAKPGDLIVVSSKVNPKNRVDLEVTEKVIEKKLTSLSLPLESLDLLNYSYTSVRGESIGIYPLYYKEKLINTIEDINDDSLNIHSKNIVLETKWNPSTSADNKTRFKDNYIIEMFANADNSFDVRNLGINLKDDERIITVIPPDSELGQEGVVFNYPYLKWRYPPKNFKPVSIQFTLQTQLEDIDKNFLLRVSPLSNKGIEETVEGDGGIFIYLDLPFEGIYRAGKLVVDNLPKIDTEKFKDGKDLKVDFTIDSNSSKYIFPYVIEEDQLDSLIYQSLEYISFPIKLGSDTVGTYTIFNDRIPYIRIKLKRQVASSESLFMRLKYPTDNIHFIRNSYLKLRNVLFDTNLGSK